MSVEGIVRIPLRRFEDERGWFCELRRDGVLPRPTVQTNVSLSYRGVIRGLHYHERGQDDLFACLQGTARVVVLDRSTGDVFSEDIGVDNPVALYIPGHHPHGFAHGHQAFMARRCGDQFAVGTCGLLGKPLHITGRVQHLGATFGQGLALLARDQTTQVFFMGQQHVVPAFEMGRAFARWG